MIQRLLAPASQPCDRDELQTIKEIEQIHASDRVHLLNPDLMRSVYFQIGWPEPGKPSSPQMSLTLSTTDCSMRSTWPHSRLVSGGHLSVASRPILEPSPDSGLAKSR